MPVLAQSGCCNDPCSQSFANFRNVEWYPDPTILTNGFDSVRFSLRCYDYSNNSNSLLLDGVDVPVVGATLHDFLRYLIIEHNFEVTLLFGAPTPVIIRAITDGVSYIGIRFYTDETLWNPCPCESSFVRATFTRNAPPLTIVNDSLPAICCPPLDCDQPTDVAVINIELPQPAPDYIYNDATNNACWGLFLVSDTCPTECDESQGVVCLAGATDYASFVRNSYDYLAEVWAMPAPNVTGIALKFPGDDILQVVLDRSNADYCTFQFKICKLSCVSDCPVPTGFIRFGLTFGDSINGLSVNLTTLTIGNCFTINFLTWGCAQPSLSATGTQATDDFYNALIGCPAYLAANNISVYQDPDTGEVFITLPDGDPSCCGLGIQVTSTGGNVVYRSTPIFCCPDLICPWDENLSRVIFNITNPGTYIFGNVNSDACLGIFRNSDPCPTSCNEASGLVCLSQCADFNDFITRFLAYWNTEWGGGGGSISYNGAGTFTAYIDNEIHGVCDEFLKPCLLTCTTNICNYLEFTITVVSILGLGAANYQATINCPGGGVQVINVNFNTVLLNIPATRNNLLNAIAAAYPTYTLTAIGNTQIRVRMPCEVVDEDCQCSSPSISASFTGGLLTLTTSSNLTCNQTIPPAPVPIQFDWVEQLHCCPVDCEVPAGFAQLNFTITDNGLIYGNAASDACLGLFLSSEVCPVNCIENGQMVCLSLCVNYTDFLIRFHSLVLARFGGGMGSVMHDLAGNFTLLIDIDWFLSEYGTDVCDETFKFCQLSCALPADCYFTFFIHLSQPLSQNEDCDLSVSTTCGLTTTELFYVTWNTGASLGGACATAGPALRDAIKALHPNWAVSNEVETIDGNLWCRILVQLPCSDLPPECQPCLDFVNLTYNYDCAFLAFGLFVDAQGFCQNFGGGVTQSFVANITQQPECCPPLPPPQEGQVIDATIIDGPLCCDVPIQVERDRQQSIVIVTPQNNPLCCPPNGVGVEVVDCCGECAPLGVEQAPDCPVLEGRVRATFTFADDLAGRPFSPSGFDLCGILEVPGFPVFDSATYFGNTNPTLVQAWVAAINSANFQAAYPALNMTASGAGNVLTLEFDKVNEDCCTAAVSLYSNYFDFTHGSAEINTPGATLCCPLAYETQPLLASDYVLCYTMGKNINPTEYFQNIVIDPSKIPFNCFGLKFTGQDGSTFYTECYRKEKCLALLEFCGNNRTAKDCSGNIYGLPDLYCSNCEEPPVYNNCYKIYGELEPVQIEFETTDSVRTAKRTYRLRAPKMPFYVIERLKDVIMGDNLTINGKRFDFSGVITKNLEGSHMWLLDVQLTEYEYCERGENCE